MDRIIVNPVIAVNTGVDPSLQCMQILSGFKISMMKGKQRWHVWTIGIEVMITRRLQCLVVRGFANPSRVSGS